MALKNFNRSSNMPKIWPKNEEKSLVQLVFNQFFWLISSTRKSYFGHPIDHSLVAAIGYLVLLSYIKKFGDNNISTVFEFFSSLKFQWY